MDQTAISATFPLTMVRMQDPRLRHNEAKYLHFCGHASDSDPQPDPQVPAEPPDMPSGKLERVRGTGSLPHVNGS